MQERLMPRRSSETRKVEIRNSGNSGRAERTRAGTASRRRGKGSKKQSMTKREAPNQSKRGIWQRRRQVAAVCVRRGNPNPGTQYRFCDAILYDAIGYAVSPRCPTTSQPRASVSCRPVVPRIFPGCKTRGLLFYSRPQVAQKHHPRAQARGFGIICVNLCNLWF